jgi:hypothetical protein
MRTFRPHPWFCLCALAGSLSAAAPSAAQPLPGGTAPAKDDALSDTARELFSKGAKAAEQQKWDQCRAALLAALSIKRHPQIAGNLAACEAKLGLYRDAAEHAAYFLSDIKPGTSTEKRMSGQAILNDAMGKIAAATISVSVKGAEVVIDGRSVGTAPLSGPVFLDPGKHTVEAKQEGYVTARVSLDAKAGTTPAVTLQLEKPEVEAPPPPPPPPPPVARLIWPLAVGAGVTVVLLAGGIGLTIAANGKMDDAISLGAQVRGRSVCYGKPAGAVASTCDDLRTAVADNAAFSNAAMASFIASGVVALGTAGFGFFTLRTKSTTEVQVAPTVGAGHGGIVLTGTW